MHNHENGRVTPLGSNQRTYKVNEEPFYRPRSRLGTVQTNVRILGRLCSLTRLAVSDILKNITVHISPKEICCYLPKCFERPQMTRKYSQEIM